MLECCLLIFVVAVAIGDTDNVRVVVKEVRWLVFHFVGKYDSCQGRAAFQDHNQLLASQYSGVEWSVWRQSHNQQQTLLGCYRSS